MKKIIYWSAYESNFGDDLNPVIVDKLQPHCETQRWTVPNSSRVKHIPGRCMSSIGSIIHLLPDGCGVWGTGHNPNYKRVPKNMKVFATRGPLSLKYLNEHGYDLDENEVSYGDPALLIPRLFPEWLEPVDIKHEVTWIPHHNDKNYYANANDKINIVQCNSGVENVINQIRASKKIISSSLHGVIVGEMLNKDAVWLQLPKSKKSETDAKYQDYYQSTERYEILPARTLEEAMKMKVAKPIYDDTRLYESFYECLNYGDVDD